MRIKKGINLTELFTDEKEIEKSRPYFNHSVEFKKNYSAKERMNYLEKVGLNVFFFPSEMITGCDLLSDSGTTTMTNEQWAALHLGDEAYGSNKGYFLLADRIKEIFGEKFFNVIGRDKSKTPNAFIFHQGRPSEDALFTEVGKVYKNRGAIIPSNGHFDTTEANIERNGIIAMNLFSPELKKEHSKEKFKGDMDVGKLRRVLNKDAKNIPLVYITITNNTGGGQPVSMKNIRKVSVIAHSYNIPLFLDACRFSENAYFIKKYEQGYRKKEIRRIIKEMFSYCDGFTISFKKDGLVNMGGGLFIKDGGTFMKKYQNIPNNLMNLQIVKEGHPTYGGLSGRNIMALYIGLDFSTRIEYLEHRIKQVKKFGELMNKEKIPVLMPPGGHAIYLDVNKFFKGTEMKPYDFGGISIAALLLGLYGHRACELGNYAFGRFDSRMGKEIFPEVNFVRFAIPRLRYEDQDLRSVAYSVKALYENRDNIPGVEVIYGKDLELRHFKSKFRFKKKNFFWRNNI